MQNVEKAMAGDAYKDNNLVFPNELGETTDPSNLARILKFFFYFSYSIASDF